MKKPVSVLVLIHTPDLQVLLLERAAHPGFWQSVTGSQEGEEPLIATALRETAEETGLAAKVEDLVDWRLANRYQIFPEWRHRYPPGVTENTEHVFSLMLPLAAPVAVAPAEHLGYRWLPWREAARAVFSWSNRDAILMLALGPQRR
ncbi:MAG: dihydroneopterin triphosphate diphosphatase [Rhodocyclaceae bacterium]|nr:dihydroneopterin triphosphate diphosphatase [Rhodocyclaceae bacterium]